MARPQLRIESFFSPSSQWCQQLYSAPWGFLNTSPVFPSRRKKKKTCTSPDINGLTKIKPQIPKASCQRASLRRRWLICYLEEIIKGSIWHKFNYNHQGQSCKEKMKVKLNLGLLISSNEGFHRYAVAAFIVSRPRLRPNRCNKRSLETSSCTDINSQGSLYFKLVSVSPRDDD